MFDVMKYLLLFKKYFGDKSICDVLNFFVHYYILRVSVIAK